MEISIVIPVYNKADYVADCLKNALEQDFDSFEVIAVDDGSTDGSGAICDEVAKDDSRLRVLHFENGGVTAARRKGVEDAKGRYIMFLDSDDRLLPGALRKTYDAIKKTDADEVFGTYEDQNGNKYDSGHRGWTDVEPLVWDLLGRRNKFCVTWGILFKKEILSNCINTTRLIANGEDILMQIKVLMKDPKVYFIPDCIYLYNVGVPNNRQRNLEEEKIYDRELKKTLQPKWGKYESGLLLHQIKLYEKFVLSKKFNVKKEYYGQFRKNISKDIPLLDRIAFCLPPRLTYILIRIFRKIKGMS